MTACLSNYLCHVFCCRKPSNAGAPILREKASNFILNAIECECMGRLTEAHIYYEAGLRMHLDYMKTAPPGEMRKLKKKFTRYLTRAEANAMKVSTEKKNSSYHEEIHISDSKNGYSYDNLFGRFLKDDVLAVKIEDPYIKMHHQFINFVRFCELLVRKCPKLRRIILHTKPEGDEQNTFLSTIKRELKIRNITFEAKFSDTLHDRKITLSNGWIIKIGRGLDYFKPIQNKFSLGTYDMNLRACCETKVDIYFKNDVKIEG